MKLWMRMRMVMIAPLFFASMSVSAQEHTDFRVMAIGEFGVYQATGYQFPFLGFGVGLDLQTRHVLLQVEGLISRTDKQSFKNLSQYYGTGRGLIRIGHLGLGGGMTYSRLTFNESGETRSAARPFVSVGYIDRSVLLTAEWVLPGQDRAYRVQRPVLHGEVSPFKGSQYVRFAAEFSYPMFVNRSGNYQNSGLEASLCLKLIPF